MTDDVGRQGDLDRSGKIMYLVDRDGKGLEIGPSHSPIAPRRAGFDVDVMDVMTADELRVHYGVYPEVDVTAIEDVDFVWKGEPLPEIVGGRELYDWIIASHVIEHSPDPVSLLIGCEAVLRPGGVLSLVIPDARFCFDHFRPLTSTGELLDAFHQKRSRPTPGTVFDYKASAVRRSGHISWDLDYQGEWELIDTLDEASKHWQKVLNTEEYVDAHVSRFIPESFRLIVGDLQELDLTRLAVVQEFDTIGHEFYVTLRSTGPAPHVGRLDAMLEIEGAIASRDRTGPAGEPPATDESRPSEAMEVSPLERRLILQKRKVLGAVRSAMRRRG